MVIELEAVDRTTFVQALAVENRPDLRPAIGTTAGGIADHGRRQSQ